jgi:hypothetical protein
MLVPRDFILRSSSTKGYSSSFDRFCPSIPLASFLTPNHEIAMQYNLPSLLAMMLQCCMHKQQVIRPRVLLFHTDTSSSALWLICLLEAVDKFFAISQDTHYYYYLLSEFYVNKNSKQLVHVPEHFSHYNGSKHVLVQNDPQVHKLCLARLQL